MPQLLRFEGSSPEEARRKAVEALGEDVVLVRAGRQRSGGLLGFFEHEVFVVEVETSLPSAILAAPSGTAPFDTGPFDTGPSDPGPFDPGPSGTGPSGTGPFDTGPSGTAPSGTAASGTALAGGTAGTAGGRSSGHPVAEPAPRDRLDALVDGVCDDFQLAAGSRYGGGHDPLEVPAEPLAGSQAPARAEASEPPASKSQGPIGSISREFSEVLEEAEATVAAARSVAARRTELPGAPGSPAAVPPPFPLPPPVGPPVGPPVEPATSLGFAAPTPPENAPEPEPQLRLEPARLTSRLADRSSKAAACERAALERRGEAARQLLRDLGLPEQLVPDPSEPVDLGLLAKLRLLPQAPPLPDSDDAVVLVAGSAQHLGALSLSLARRLGIGADAVIAVSTRPRGMPACAAYVASARDAAAEVADRRISGRPSVVAVDARVSGPLPRLIANVASAIRPDACWAVVPARSRPEQVRALGEALRGLDAICVVELDEAERPASLLAAGCPVAALDRRAATPLMWAARLMDRCATEGVEL